MAEDGAKPAGRVTIRTVAADAGVSVAAVSKVLRNAYGVSDALRANVAESIHRLGYRPNVAARGLRGHSFTLGMLLTDLDNPFLATVIEGATEAISPAGYKMLIGVGQAKVPIETQLLDSMLDYRMDGLILIAPRLGPAILADYARQIPIVAIGHHEPQAAGFDTVNSDDRRGAELVVEHLVRRGYRDIAMVSLDLGVDHRTNVSDLREDGYLAAMAAAGLSDRARITHLAQGPAERERAQIMEYLAAPDLPRAVFCWSDLHAVPLRNAAAALGIAVPDRLAIAGYDNSPVAALPLIDLSSIDQSGGALGSAAAALVLSRIEGRIGAEHRLIPPRLVQRTST